MSPASTLVLGLVLGLRHATDPDHVVAMGTIVTRDPHLRRAIVTGVWWGIGHTVTVLGVGLLMLIGGVRLPDRATSAMELLVAAMLIVLGALALRTSFVALAPAVAPAPAPAPRLGERLLVSPLRPLLIGLVHGLAGSAALTLVALATIQDTRGAMLYLALFGVGTVVGMVVVTTLLALSLRWVTVGDLAKATGRTVSLVSQQMRVLRDAKLVKGSRDGRQIVYAVVNRKMHRLLDTCLEHAMKSGQSR